jgi:thiol-disulfide isomerase/thioredoxin
MPHIITTFKSFLCSVLLAGAATAQADKPTQAAATPEGGTSAADKAWSALQQAGKPPQQPEGWSKARPSEAEIEAFKKSEAERLVKAADQAKDFQSAYPGDARLDQAKSKEYELLGMAAQFGNTNVAARLDSLDEAKLKDPKITEEQRFQVRANSVNRKAVAKLSESRAAAFAELEKGARSLIKEFPDKPVGYQMLQQVAAAAEPEKAVKLAKEISDSKAPDAVKDAVKPLLQIGKPLAIKFTAVDGQQVDLAKLKGKVVLIDFWATWCGPCVHEVPNVVAAYQKLHPKGFEIVGISFDQDKDKLTTFTKAQKMTWPQYFDGKQWANEFGKQFGIQSIPTMWLVDKKGNLVDTNGRDDLAAKVEKMLAEPM